jgi:hypothetical protein
MSTEQYLQKKFGMYPNADMPIEMLIDELHITLLEAKALVRTAIKKKSCPLYIKFSIFVGIVALALR